MATEGRNHEWLYDKTSLVMNIRGVATEFTTYLSQARTLVILLENGKTGTGSRAISFES